MKGHQPNVQLAQSVSGIFLCMMGLCQYFALWELMERDVKINLRPQYIFFFNVFLSICKSVLFILFNFFSLHPRPSIVAWTSITSISWRPSTSGSSTNSTRSRSWNSGWATTEGNFKICCFFRFPPSPRLLCVFCEAKAKRAKQVHGWVYSSRGWCGGQAGGHQEKKEEKKDMLVLDYGQCWPFIDSNGGVSPWDFSNLSSSSVCLCKSPVLTRFLSSDEPAARSCRIVFQPTEP